MEAPKVQVAAEAEVDLAEEQVVLEVRLSEVVP